MSLADAEHELRELSVKLETLRKNLSEVILGKGEVIDYVMMSLLAGESILIEDVPGVGKTTIAKALAASLELDFQRVQCTPDLLPADIFGVSIFKPKEGTFEFRKGPVFCNILLVDEINRASPRTQSALLEAMAERQITIEGETYKLPQPFMVIATQNPLGFHGTFPLPESQLDRFLMQISMDYPDPDVELEILYQESGAKPVNHLKSVLTRPEVIALQEQLNEVRFDRSLGQYLIDIVAETRHDQRIELGCSPRGAISFFKTAKAKALLAGRDYVLPDDIQYVAPLVLRHRIAFEGSNQSMRARCDEIISELIERVNVPV